METKQVITIATGKALYLNLAVNLARSFQYWNKRNGILFYIVTDFPQYVPSDVLSFAQIITIKKEELGLGFTPKLYLNQLAPDGQTLFIDSDCLVYGDLTAVFKQFKNHQVSAIGNFIADGEWFGEVKKICEKFNIPHLPKFNGGVYYLEKSEIADKVYQKARALEQTYDEIGFVRLRNRPNDEVLMALAMQLFDQNPIAEDGSIMAEFVNFQSGIKSDLLGGKVILYNSPNHKNYIKNWPLLTAQPLIVHYLGYHNMINPYLKEAKLLELLAYRWPKFLAIVYTQFLVTIPYKVKVCMKKIFRPLYRLFFGYRTIVKSERIID